MFLDVYLKDFNEGSPEYKLLSIFSYGTWSDYLSFESSCPKELKLEPNSEAARKLKKLTLLSLGAKESCIQFAKIKKELSIDNVADLESLVIDLMASNYIDAKIDEQTSCIICDRAVSRCVKNDEESIKRIIQEIKNFRDKISNALKVQ
ncbi:COP9 signalosome complex subunit 7a [Histomonas meleagridis]|uniref:COP9 signalosome complex subunit 7a n=1 Tax=Histomonas meleagridis TaxID=135588 RepID=UPI0035595FA1|nr:COP9 signalosome complex subunit 7a [Histomonas meleagridis]